MHGQRQGSHADGSMISNTTMLEGGPDSANPAGSGHGSCGDGEQAAEGSKGQFLLDVEENYSSISLNVVGQHQLYEQGLQEGAGEVGVNGEMGDAASERGAPNLMLPQLQPGHAGDLLGLPGGQLYVTPRLGP
jgi:hypothetical protein